LVGSNFGKTAPKEPPTEVKGRRKEARGMRGNSHCVTDGLHGPQECLAETGRQGGPLKKRFPFRFEKGNLKFSKKSVVVSPLTKA